MKRTAVEVPPLSSTSERRSSTMMVKRRSSSTFSITTVLDDEECHQLTEFIETKLVSLGGGELQTATTDEPDITTTISTTTTTTLRESTDVPSEEEDCGLFFDEDGIGNSDAVVTKNDESYLPQIHVSLPKRSRLNNYQVETHHSKDNVMSSSSLCPDFRTGIVFASGEQHYDVKKRQCQEHPKRIQSIVNALGDELLSSRYCLLTDPRGTANSSSACQLLNEKDYLRVHLQGYMQRLFKLSTCSCQEKLDLEADQFKSIYLTKDSVNEAKRAASSLCSLVSKVVADELDNGFGIIRPPGHHADLSVAGGYCLINNVAVAAAYARDKLNVGKIIIVDWDVHHGNGTQSIFLDDPTVLYFSVHRWHNGNFFPFTKNSGPNVVGIGKGEGFNVNVGWTCKGVGDDEYLAVWERLLLPIAREFNPDLVLVSAGFDAAVGDLGECNVTPDGFATLTKSLMTLANGRVVCALEGGYVPSVLGKCVTSVVHALLDRTMENEEGVMQGYGRQKEDVLDAIDPTAAKNIRATISAHSLYWKCLQVGCL